MSKFTQRLADLGFSNYALYLRSPHWAEFKQRYRESGLPVVCAVCTSTRIHLHHHTYERLGCEDIRDVTPLCEVHHNQVHACLKIRRWTVDQTPNVIAFLQSGGAGAVPEFANEQWMRQQQARTFRRKLKKEKQAKKQEKGLQRASRRAERAEEILELGTDAFADLAREVFRLYQSNGGCKLRHCLVAIASRDMDLLQERYAILTGQATEVSQRSRRKKKKRRRK